MRIIKFNTCNDCPYIREDSGRGYYDGIVKCIKFNIILFDGDGPEYFDYMNGIHPDCKLEEDCKHEDILWSNNYRWCEKCKEAV